MSRTSRPLPEATVPDTDLPKEGGLDSSLAFIRDPYRFVSTHCRELDSSAFSCRLMLQRTVCMSGCAASEFFYTTPSLSRIGAMPGLVVKTLLGEGGVQGLDDERHAHRKRMFMSVMDDDSLDAVQRELRDAWQALIDGWDEGEERLLYKDAIVVLADTACRWAGVPLEAEELVDRAKMLSLMFDAAGSVGPRHLESRAARERADRWAAGLIDDIRDTGGRATDGRAAGGKETPAEVVAMHRDLDGNLLPREIAAVELLNLLRPIVAIAVFVVDTVHALDAWPEHLEPIRAGDEAHLHRFVQEVRRYYPFFPVSAALTIETVEFDGYTIPADTRIMLDLHGTNRERGRWDDPDRFDPSRFEDRADDPYGFIPQGGGDFVQNHRCAGEWLTIRLMEESLRMLVGEMRWTLPEQDMTIDYSRLPAVPMDRVRMVRVGG